MNGITICTKKRKIWIFLALCCVGIIGFLLNVNENSWTHKGEKYEIDVITAGTFEGKYSEEELGDYHISFKGYLDSEDDFNSICIGKGKDGPLGNYLYIDTSKIEIRQNCDNAVVDSGLHKIISWSNYISVIINAGNDGNADIKVVTAGGSFSKKMKWKSNYQKLFITADNETILKNCTLSYYCDDWKKDIWLFGDSYFSLDETDRWTTYLIKSGVDNFMLNGRSGRGSEEALVALKYCLQYGTPKKIIWCLGMNDGDDGAINRDYERALQEVMDICNNKKITLILATIPSCPYWNNDYKNQYVRGSGYPYIDFAKAVGADNNITWYDGMLEEGEKRIHPTVKGAIALYHEAITTVPDLMVKKTDNAA